MLRINPTDFVDLKHWFIKDTGFLGRKWKAKTTYAFIVIVINSIIIFVDSFLNNRFMQETAIWKNCVHSKSQLIC